MRALYKHNSEHTGKWLACDREKSVGVLYWYDCNALNCHLWFVCGWQGGCASRAGTDQARRTIYS
jgi:hypothetical protein